MTARGRPLRHVVVLTTTYPRWDDDAMPSFVYDFAQHVAEGVERVTVIAPHCEGARTRERHGKVHVRRFRYAPARHQDLAYEGGAVSRIRATPAYALKLAAFLTAMLAATVAEALRTRGCVINPHWLLPQGVVALLAGRLTGRGVVVTVHGADVFSLNQRWLRAVKRVVLGRAQSVVTNSSATRAVCRSLHPGRDYPVIPMGVDVDERFVVRERPAALAERLGVDGFTVLFVGRLSQEKGVAYLCDAFAQLAEDGRRAHLVVVGDGSERSRVEALRARPGLRDRVHLVGWQQQRDLADYYALADVFVGPSVEQPDGWKEAYGLVFVEALASGTPVIATRTGGIADIVADGDNGFLVEQRDAAQIAERIAALMDDDELRARLARNARTRVSDGLSWRAVTERYLAVLRAAVRR